MHIYNIFYFIKKYFIVLISVFLLMLIIFIANVVAMTNAYGAYNVKQMLGNIEEYNEVDLDQLCKISNCNKIIVNYNKSNELSYEKTNNNLHKTNNKFEVTNFIGMYFIKDDLTLCMLLPHHDILFGLNLDLFFGELRLSYGVTFVLVYGLVFVLLLIFYYNEYKEHLLQTMGNEAILSNKSMIMITENIHHEMNTPLEVIDNKFEKIHKIITDYLISFSTFFDSENEINVQNLGKFNRKVVLLQKDFDYIRTSIEQIFGTLDKMRGFKHLRYSNGNKNMFDIAEGSVKIISVSNPNFNYNVDQVLRSYKIRSKILKNIDLLNIIINHLKNSLEAKATEIIIRVSKYNESNNNLFILIIDNGNGIPKEALHNIFSANFSTKKDSYNVRGNGLYLNKYILNACGGDVRVVDSNANGTIIELKVPAYFIGVK